MHMVANLGDYPKTIEANKIAFMETNNTERFVIASKLPNPEIDGKTYHRDVQVSGIQILDDKGDKIG